MQYKIKYKADGKPYLKKADGYFNLLSFIGTEPIPDTVTSGWNADGILSNPNGPQLRPLIGGGVNYQNNEVLNDYIAYYSQVVDQYNYTITNGRLAYDNIWCSDYLWSPYRDAFQNNVQLPYAQAIGSGGSGVYYFNFMMPVMLTKYRLWNAFKAGVLFPDGFVANKIRYSDFGNQTPRSWKIQGTNDDLFWEDVDVRTNQDRLPYATSNIAGSSDYGEFHIENIYDENGDLILGEKPYKTFRFIVTEGGRDAYGCNKSGCSYDWQLGEIQLWGLESKTSSCALHGYYSSLPLVKYIDSTGALDNSTFKKAFYKSGGLGNDSKNMRAGNVKKEFHSCWDIPEKNSSNSPDYLQVGQTAVGYIELDYFVEIISYSLRSGISVRGGAITYLAAWELYGSPKHPAYNEWYLMDERCGITYNSIEIDYKCSNPGAFKYFKFVAKDGYPRLGCDKSGNCGMWAVRIGDIQLKGSHKDHWYRIIT